MTDRELFRRPGPAWLFALLCFVAPLVAQAQAPFDATYEIRVDGKPRLESRIRLYEDGDRWVLESSSEGTRGLAAFLNVGSKETSKGSWVGGIFRPVEFRHHARVAGVDERWEARFEWLDGLVRTRTEEGAHALEVAPDTVDPLSLTLTLGRMLAQGTTDFEVEVVDEDTIDTHRYTSGGSQALNTALGCLDTTTLERVRENSKRYSTGWYAKGLNYLPVRVRHGKRGGKEFDMRIQSLELNGQPVARGDDCPG